MPSASPEELEARMKAIKSVSARNRVAEVHCPVHLDQVIAIMTTDGLMLDAGGAVDARGATHMLLGVCRTCDGDPDYRIDPDKLRMFARNTKTRPAKPTANEVRWDGPAVTPKP